VLKGLENLSVVARLYGVDPAIIRSANPAVDFNRLRPGDSINIPLNTPGLPGGASMQGQRITTPPLPPAPVAPGS